MTPSVGIVVPAYRPDAERLGAYLRALDERMAPAVIRVELDSPDREPNASGRDPGALDREPDTLDHDPDTLDRDPDALDHDPDAPEGPLRHRLGALPDSVEVATATTRRGKGAAITAGFEALVDRVDVLAFADADGSTPAESFESVIDAVVSGEADLAAGSRRHPDADVAAHQTFARRRLGDGFAWLARRFLDEQLYDYQCGAKALTAETWRAVRPHLYEPGFAWDIELVAVASALNHTVVEIPVRWEDHPESTVSTVGTTLRLARALVLSRHRAKLLREDRLHTLLDAGRPEEPSLVERLAATDAADAVEAD